MDQSEFLAIDSDNMSKLKVVFALQELLKERKYQDIRVGMICETAHISRQTFYYHFGGKFEVVQWYWGYLASQHLLRVGKDLSWEESLTMCYSSIFSERGFFLEVTRDEKQNYESITLFARKMREETLKNVIHSHPGDEVPEDIYFQISFFVEAESGMINRWLWQTEPENPETLATKIATCMPRELHDMLNSWAKTEPVADLS